jgi:hypothetical protein
VYASSVINETIHLATENGSYTVDSKSLLDKKEWIKGITLDELRINNNPYNSSDFETKDILQLSANENSFELVFLYESTPLSR